METSKLYKHVIFLMSVSKKDPNFDFKSCHQNMFNVNTLSLQVQAEMCTTKLFALLLVTLCESKKSLVPQAISELIQLHDRKSSEKIEIFYNSDRIEILDETLKLLSDVKDVKVTKIVIDKKLKGQDFHNDAIFIFDTVENYSKFEAISGFYAPNEQIENNFWFYCEDLTKFDISRVIPESQSFKSYLIEENDEIVLNALVMYTEQQCRTP